MPSFNQQAMYHIALTEEQGAEYAIITGDPGRVESIARLLDSPEFVASNREYTTWAGNIGGRRILVTSHGIGGPSTAICVEELALCGVKTIIRVGTCGGMSQSVYGGDLVIANAAIRQEGTSLEYLPIAFPAVSDFDVTSALVKSADEMGERFHVGVVHCKDSFYGQHKPEESPVSYQLQNRWQAWIRGGCLASEMESAALYTVAAAKGLKAGCILHVVWNHEREAAGHKNKPIHDTTHAAKAAVGAIRLLMK
ncbi:MAG: nucleoside phosphorylase [Oscillospiraceae bacterium]|nr:nucleoside phosphorylase [Oscillospiraceae bacterium]MDD4413747.1 nucleoside phosphorylase [Oscillospiraceae bacterium]